MESEKVKEIKKALEYAIDMGLAIGKNTMFANIKLADILTLINELESENERLNKELKRYKLDWLNSEKMHLQADMEDTEFELFCANKSLGEVRTENKKLKDRIAELEKEVETRKEEVLHLQEYGKKLIRETELKQFAERLKEEFIKSANIQDSITAKKLFRDICPVKVDKVLKKFIKEK